MAATVTLFDLQTKGSQMHLRIKLNKIHLHLLFLNQIITVPSNVTTMTHLVSG